MAYIRLLHDLERKAGDLGLDGEERLALRQAKSRPLPGDVKAYLERNHLQMLPLSKNWKPPERLKNLPRPSGKIKVQFAKF